MKPGEIYARQMHQCPPSVADSAAGILQSGRRLANCAWGKQGVVEPENVLQSASAGIDFLNSILVFEASNSGTLLETRMHLLREQMAMLGRFVGKGLRAFE
jgi:hypothetical protein